jgi:acetyl-CoA C-acetyltransferase
MELMDGLAHARVTAGGQLHPEPGGMVETAENLRRQFGISRREQDELALRSQQTTAAAMCEGRFNDEIVAVTLLGGRGKDPIEVTKDEHPRPETTMEDLAALRPARVGIDPEATVTAGNASGQNDGARDVRRHDPRGGRAERTSPVPSRAVLGRGRRRPRGHGHRPGSRERRRPRESGSDDGHIDLIELNETFTPQVLAVLREWALGKDDYKRVNVNGSGTSMGHPVGATGARILATLAHEMHRRGRRYGLETMCIGGGQGLAAVFEAVR